MQGAFFSFLPVALIVGLSITVAQFFTRKRQARVAHAKALAARHGFQVDTSVKPPPEQDFDLFGAGSAQKVSFQFWRPGENDSVFRYQYTTGSGDNRQTHRRTVALISLPFAAPHTKIGPEGFWSGIGRFIGIRDIEVESTEFNNQYRVTSDDERFAITLLDQAMMAWLLSTQSGRGAIRFELWGSWLLCVSEELDIELMFGFLDWAQEVRSHMPGVLASLYPATRH